jgi:hypothetical protein
MTIDPAMPRLFEKNRNMPGNARPQRLFPLDRLGLTALFRGRMGQACVLAARNFISVSSGLRP